MDTTLPLTTENIDALLQFLPVFESPGFRFGNWHWPAGRFPWFEASQEATEFRKALRQQRWIIDFDWRSWQDEALRYCESSSALAGADLDTLRKLLTTHIRKERTCEGHLAAMHESGHLTAVLRRLNEIRAGD